jgi:WD40 repeat protein
MSKVEVKKLAAITGHKDCIYTLAQGGTSQLFYSAAGDGMVASWDLEAPENGRLVAKLDNSIYALCYISEAGFLVAGHNYDGIHFIDTAKGKEKASLKLTDAAIFDIQYYRDLLFVATGSGEVIIIDWPNVKIVRRLKFSDKSARTIAVNPVDRHLAVGYSDATIRVIDLQTYDVVHTIDSHTNSVFSVCYSPDFKWLLSGGRDAHLKVWDVEKDYVAYESIVAHMYAINHIVYNPSGSHFVTCSMDKSIKVWDASTLQLIKVIDKARHAGHGTSVNKMLWTAYNDQLVSASDDRSISVWDLNFNPSHFE